MLTAQVIAFSSRASSSSSMVTLQDSLAEWPRMRINSAGEKQTVDLFHGLAGAGPPTPGGTAIGVAPAFASART
ncbi:hypothetical protein SANTM175S_06005 [Streptomyces antimycoticus]